MIQIKGSIKIQNGIESVSITFTEENNPYAHQNADNSAGLFCVKINGKKYRTPRHKLFNLDGIFALFKRLHTTAHTKQEPTIRPGDYVSVKYTVELEGQPYTNQLSGWAVTPPQLEIDGEWHIWVQHLNGIINCLARNVIVTKHVRNPIRTMELNKNVYK